MNGDKANPGKSSWALGATGVVMAACCIAGPAIIGAVAGASLGGFAGVGAAVVIALTLAGGVALWRRRRGEPAC
jgi:hypothetical protein